MLREVQQLYSKSPTDALSNFQRRQRASARPAAWVGSHVSCASSRASILHECLCLCVLHCTVSYRAPRGSVYLYFKPRVSGSKWVDSIESIREPEPVPTAKPHGACVTSHLALRLLLLMILQLYHLPASLPPPLSGCSLDASPGICQLSYCTIRLKTFTFCVWFFFFFFFFPLFFFNFILFLNLT